MTTIDSSGSNAYGNSLPIVEHRTRSGSGFDFINPFSIFYFN